MRMPGRILGGFLVLLPACRTGEPPLTSPTATTPAEPMVRESTPEAEPAPELAPTPTPAPESTDWRNARELAFMKLFIESQDLDRSDGTWRLRLPRPPQMDFDPDRTFFWELDTNQGPLKIRLMPEVAPMHVSSTIYLALLGFYDGLGFHRVIPGFMAQGGCPLGIGTGNPGYRYGDEFSPDVRHDRPGLLSMANAGPGTDGCQFFITFVPTPHLDGRHTIFGQVVEGMDTLGKLEARGTRSGTTTERLTIRETRITVE